jgi:hypothetical protein
MSSGDGRVRPDWRGPPEGWFGGVLPTTPLVARNPRGAITVEDIAVYPTGLGFDLRVILRPPPAPSRPEPRKPSPPADEQFLDGPPSVSVYVAARPTPDEDWEPPVNIAERARFGVEFEDGRRAWSDDPVGGPGGFTIREFQEGKPGAPDPEVNVVLNCSGGSSGPEFMHRRYFVWPLPVGAIKLFGSWPDIGLEEESAELDARLIADGLARARRGWV